MVIIVVIIVKQIHMSYCTCNHIHRRASCCLTCIYEYMLDGHSSTRYDHPTLLI